MKILGHVICITEEFSTQKNWSLVLKKCYGVANKLAGLSLDTRSKIMIVKTFILSQLCYTAQCFKPSQEILAKIEELICNFLNYGRDNFSQSIIFKPLDELGLGVPKLYTFCMSQLQKNCCRAINIDQPWAMILRSNYKLCLLDRIKIDNIGSSYMNDLSEAMSEMAVSYYKNYNYEVPLFFTKYIIDKVDPHLFNGNPPRPNGNTQANFYRLNTIKLKDLYQQDGVFKSKQAIQDLFGYQISLNSYMNLRSAAFQCPLRVMTNKNLIRVSFLL